mmetsp:Transcript_19280/g.49433  ORF Transcript_19280/g.49433 Transcript_19280/m.49433 type:complete len:144 (+) Transcript_19280:3598-4029(+)
MRTRSEKEGKETVVRSMKTTCGLHFSNSPYSSHKHHGEGSPLRSGALDIDLLHALHEEGLLRFAPPPCLLGLAWFVKSVVVGVGALLDFGICALPRLRPAVAHALFDRFIKCKASYCIYFSFPLGVPPAVARCSLVKGELGVG